MECGRTLSAPAAAADARRVRRVTKAEGITSGSPVAWELKAPNPPTCGGCDLLHQGVAHTIGLVLAYLRDGQERNILPAKLGGQGLFDRKQLSPRWRRKPRPCRPQMKRYLKAIGPRNARARSRRGMPSGSDRSALNVALPQVAHSPNCVQRASRPTCLRRVPFGEAPSTYAGNVDPDCSATMYSAYQSGQASSWRPPSRFSCSPCAAAALFRALARSLAEANKAPVASVRPGRRAVTSWNTQPFPSGSEKDAKEE